MKKFIRNKTLLINDKIFENPFSEIDEFNKAILNYYIKKLVEEFGDQAKFKTLYLNSFLSVYIQLYHKDIDFKKYINYNPIETSYLVEHLYETFPYVTLIQSKLLSMRDGNIRYNNNHIFFVIPLTIFDKNEINKIKNLIKILYNNLSNNKLNYIRISVLVYNENVDDLKYLIDYNYYKIQYLDNLLKIQYRNSSSFIDFEKIYKNLNEIFNENANKNIYENKKAVLILNYNSKIPNNSDSLIEKYKKIYSIQKIPIIKIEDLKDNPVTDNFKYNIFYNFTDRNNYLSSLIMAISNMHINIDLTTEDLNEDIVEKK